MAMTWEVPGISGPDHLSNDLAHHSCQAWLKGLRCMLGFAVSQAVLGLKGGLVQ